METTPEVQRNQKDQEEDKNHHLDLDQDQDLDKDNQKEKEKVDLNPKIKLNQIHSEEDEDETKAAPKRQKINMDNHHTHFNNNNNNNNNNNDDEEDEDDSGDESPDLISFINFHKAQGKNPMAILSQLLQILKPKIARRFLWRTISRAVCLINQMYSESKRSKDNKDKDQAIGNNDDKDKGVDERERESDGGIFSSHRRRISHFNSIQHVVQLIKNSTRIIVLTGAGISVSAGIPDFRSKNGIYSRLKQEFDLSDPTCMFDMEYFSRIPQLFYSFAHELWPTNDQSRAKHKPTLTHRFIAELDKQGKLLRNYTQNIDTLEQIAGIKNVLFCHGSFATASCVTCKRQVQGEIIRDQVMNQIIPKCPDCHSIKEESINSNSNSNENLSSNTGNNNNDSINVNKMVPRSRYSSPSCPIYGVMKPDIVFFGESLPRSFHENLMNDRNNCDLVIVIGSSLKVQPVSTMISLFPENVPLILINRERVGYPDEFDVELLGDSDRIIDYLNQQLEYNIIPPDQNPPSSDTQANNTTAPLTKNETTESASQPLNEKIKPVFNDTLCLPYAPNRFIFIKNGDPLPNHGVFNDFNEMEMIDLFDSNDDDDDDEDEDEPDDHVHNNNNQNEEDLHDDEQIIPEDENEADDDDMIPPESQSAADSYLNQADEANNNNNLISPSSLDAASTKQIAETETLELD